MAEIGKANSTWRRSSYSEQENCVEARSDVGIRVRDSHRPSGPQLSLAAEAWSAFTMRLHKA
ncbi:MAG TPA: DUF397 domain-containing protein [Yinghuangia sp.]|uniref:DUF397 domain-containing protein n=1 Tax=Yinghuangia sp. YIM S10712 TaxID=3436930 RepID=UPI002B9D4002|nr:DUF397 domain-containing protein [Yinghuangia sp.]